jgi:hypothetical protein
MSAVYELSKNVSPFGKGVDFTVFEYDRVRGCLCFGGPKAREDYTKNYSWGWIIDDFGNSVMAYHQIAGWGCYEHSLHVQ